MGATTVTDGNGIYQNTNPRNVVATSTSNKCTILRKGGLLFRFDPNDPIEVKRIRECIARDYAPREGARINRVAKIRIQDLETYLCIRYGTTVPDDDAGHEDLVILLNHVAQNPDDPYGKMTRCVQTWAP